LNDLEEFENLIEDYVGVFASEYRPLAPHKPKTIHDSVWGTHIFSPAEIAFLDSPLLQRLRYIHQTALAFYTYSSANHSRLEQLQNPLRRIKEGNKEGFLKL
jgi:hypothetical protein